MVKWVMVATSVGAGTVVVGDVKYATDTFFFKRVGGTSSISGVQTRVANQSDATMSTSDLTYAVGGSNELQLTMVAPTTANGSTFRIVASVYFEEVAW
jgi:hypothetical protein